MEIRNLNIWQPQATKKDRTKEAIKQPEKSEQEHKRNKKDESQKNQVIDEYV